MPHSQILIWICNIHCSNGDAGAAAAAAALLGADYGGAAALLSAEQGGTAALLGAEQMAALLDSPLWKSRQPRMCLHCNRMFSNKFNLKQVANG